MPNPRQRRIDSDAGPLIFWGSECRACGNATRGTMTCDECGSARNTQAMWTPPDPNPEPEVGGAGEVLSLAAARDRAE